MISAEAVRLYSILDRYANTDGVAWPSRRTLADRMGFKRRESVDRALRELVLIGAITVENQVLPDAGKAANR